jgi:hypothetical protein
MFRKIMVASLCLLLACGCERRREIKHFAAAEDDSEYVIAVVVDLSGSFLEKMTEGGQAHSFMLSLLDRYFRERVGTHDQIILAQISGTPDRALLWQGSPFELRKQFPNSRAFSEFLRSKADPHGSCVHNALAQTVEYVMSQPNVSNCKAKSAVLVMSDMVDNSPKGSLSKDQVGDVLCDYAKIGGVVCLYFVDQTLIPVWERELRKAGLEFSVASEVRRPNLPSFE